MHELLTKLCSNFKINNYLEIGVQEGNSLKIILCHNYLNLKKAVLCDTYGTQYGGTGRGNHNHLNYLAEMYPNIAFTFLDLDSKIAIPAYQKLMLDLKFDLIVIDGDHSREGAYIDLCNCYEMLDDKGYMVFDDIIHPDHLYRMDMVNTFIRKTGLDIVFLDKLFEHGCIVMKKISFGKRI